MTKFFITAKHGEKRGKKLNQKKSSWEHSPWSKASYRICWIITSGIARKCSIQGKEPQNWPCKDWLYIARSSDTRVADINRQWASCFKNRRFSTLSSRVIEVKRRQNLFRNTRDSFLLLLLEIINIFAFHYQFVLLV